jgi:hypothetical protein
MAGLIKGFPRTTSRITTTTKQNVDPGPGGTLPVLAGKNHFKSNIKSNHMIIVLHLFTSSDDGRCATKDRYHRASYAVAWAHNLKTAKISLNRRVVDILLKTTLVEPRGSR